VPPLLIIMSSTWGIIKQGNTIIDNEKIEQPTITSRKVIIYWSEITSLKKDGYGRIIIRSSKNRVVISQYLFSTPQKLHHFIHTKVPSEKFMCHKESKQFTDILLMPISATVFRI